MEQLMRQYSPVPMQHGVAMVIVMIFIVILSGVAAFAARKVFLGEGLSRNQLDIEIATQAAEAALRDAEFDLQLPGSNAARPGATCFRSDLQRPVNATTVGANYFNTNCLQGQCRNQLAQSDADYSTLANSSASTNVQPWWPGGSSQWNNDFDNKPPTSTNCAFNGGVPLGTFTGAPAVRGVLRQPEYLIEYFSRGGEGYFRITARGWGLSPSSEVLMQSFFSVGILTPG
jgi:type IV pilus assembly protein PilX